MGLQLWPVSVGQTNPFRMLSLLSALRFLSLASFRLLQDVLPDDLRLLSSNAL